MIEAKLTETNAEVSSTRERLYERYRSYTSAASPIYEVDRRAAYIRWLIKAHFPVQRQAKILDLGCGTGLLLDFLRRVGYTELSGVDGSAEQLETAREQGFANVYHADVFEFLNNVADESFDVVVAFDIIEHLKRRELLRLADETHRVLKRDGRWLIHAPNAEGLFGTRVMYSDLTHERAFTRQSIEQLRRAAGFRAIECFADGPVIHGVKSMVRWLVWTSACALLRVYFVAETGDLAAQPLLSQNLLACAWK